MKKIAWAAFVAFCVVTLGGCALPEKPRVSSPPSTNSSDQSSPVYEQNGRESEISGQPGDQAKDSQQQGIVEESTEVILPSAVYINDRIFEYGRKLDRWKELDSQSVNMNLKEEEAAQMVGCFRSLQNVLSAYSALRKNFHFMAHDFFLARPTIFTLIIRCLGSRSAGKVIYL